MPEGIEVFTDGGSFQFGSQHRGMKVIRKIRIIPSRIITSDTGNSGALNYFIGNHWWSTENIFSSDAIIAIRPLDRGQRFYAHFVRGRASWFNTTSPENATFSIFVSRPCEVFIYDYPEAPPPSMAGLVAYDELGRPTFSTDGLHMRIAAFHSGRLPITGYDPIPPNYPYYASATLSLPGSDYMICPLNKPYQIYMSDEYEQGSSTFYDFIELNPWYVVGDNYVTIEPRSAYLTGLSGTPYASQDYGYFSTLVLYANWEQSYPING